MNPPDQCPCCGHPLGRHVFSEEYEVPGCTICPCLNDPANTLWHHTLPLDIQAPIDRCRDMRVAGRQG